LHASLDELTRLAETAGAEVIEKVLQFRDRKDPAWLIGKGKAEEIAQLAEETEADLVIFDQEISPAQLFHLEKLFSCKVIDRTQLILDIFASRAQTREGRLQVELAQLQYLLPRLVGRGSEMSRLGGGIGTRGPGEKKLETDRRHIRRQIARLKREIEEVKRHRQLHQRRREKNEVLQVALVGYTNAGKSTLLNQLTGAGVLSEDKLFATLDPTSRHLELPNGQNVILTDTVGFIRNLPHQLVAAFRSTLEQVKEADLLLHVVDASHPEAKTQMAVVERVLAELGASEIPMLVVYNKADLLPEIPNDQTDRDALYISAFREEDLALLKEKIAEMLGRGKIYATVEIPVDQGDLLATLYRYATVLETKVEGMTMQVQACFPLHQYERLPGELRQFIGKESDKELV
jgi:GTP-binding protein HflX